MVVSAVRMAALDLVMAFLMAKAGGLFESFPSSHLGQIPPLSIAYTPRVLLSHDAPFSRRLFLSNPARS